MVLIQDICTFDVKIPKSYTEASGIINVPITGIVFLSKNPIGIYLLFSDDTQGIIKYLSGLICSLNIVGVLASFIDSVVLAFILSSLHLLTLSSTNGILLNSDGSHPTNHRQYLFFLFINSCAPTIFFIHFFDSGHLEIKSWYSFSSI